MFKTVTANKSGTAVVNIAGYLGPVRVPFRIRPNDACGNWNIQCPIEPGNRYQLRLEVPISRNYPEIHVLVEVQLLAQVSHILLCSYSSLTLDIRNRIKAKWFVSDSRQKLRAMAVQEDFRPSHANKR